MDCLCYYIFWYLMCVYLFSMFVFFFKQKTAYEMRISDWSSDVCSSDLWPSRATAVGSTSTSPRHPTGAPSCSSTSSTPVATSTRTRAASSSRSRSRTRTTTAASSPPVATATSRSEEHTSELQSLMRISYAVFCLKKKKHPQNTHKNITSESD